VETGDIQDGHVAKNSLEILHSAF